MSVFKILAIVLLCTPPNLAYSLLNVNASFIETPQPFRITVDPVFLQETRDRVQRARQPDNTDAFPYTDGPVALNWTAVRDTWLHNYSWSDTAASINDRLQQYTILVHPENSSYDELVPLHYVHHRSNREDAIPLLFIHGWPGSFLEVINIIDLFTNPPNSSVPAFHVVAPSIPGFAFSHAPVKPGFGPVAAGDAFDALMKQLGYPKYVGQGGDLGAITLRAQAVSHPESLVSIHCNFWPIEPNATDLQRLADNETSPAETSYISGFDQFSLDSFGYGHLQQKQPLTAAYATTDSPMGLSMWIFQLIRIALDYRIAPFTSQDLVTWTMTYWIQGPYGSMRYYKQALADNFFEGYGTAEGNGYVSVPTAISAFPYDVGYDLPLDWARRYGNVLKRYKHEYGDHFAAYRTPNELAADVWDWFGDRELSGTTALYPQK